MKKSTFAVFIGLALAVGARAQDAADHAVEAEAARPPLVRRDAQPSLSAPTTTPEMWLYEQERLRHDDPKRAVRRAAEYRTEQRQRRIESRRWFGYSNSRPIASPNPWHDTYSPMWTGNSFFPYEWSGVGGPAVAFRPGWYGVGY